MSKKTSNTSENLSKKSDCPTCGASCHVGSDGALLDAGIRYLTPHRCPKPDGGEWANVT